MKISYDQSDLINSQLDILLKARQDLTDKLIADAGLDGSALFNVLSDAVVKNPDYIRICNAMLALQEAEPVAK